MYLAGTVCWSHMSAIVLFCSLKAWATDGWSEAHVGQSCWLLAINLLKLEPEMFVCLFVCLFS